MPHFRDFTRSSGTFSLKFVIKIVNWHLCVHGEQESVSGEVSIVYVDRHLTKYDKSQVY